MDKAKYKGELTKKLPPLPKLDSAAGPLAQFHQQQMIIEAIEKGIDEEFEKLPLLFNHYGIAMRDHGSYTLLVLALARDWVPGFQRADDRAGPKQNWDEVSRARLNIAIDEYIDKSETHKTDRRPTKLEAAEALLHSSAWKRKSASAAALLKQSNMANPAIVAIERDGAKRLTRRLLELTSQT